MAGNLTIESCGNIFANPSRKASSNYGIGSDGRIGLYVNECDRSWCSSSSSNDNRAITIEVANDGGAATGWHVSDKAMQSLIELCADICQRNGIKELKWKADKNLIGQVDKQNLTVHRWFAAKSCPGDYLYNKHPYIVSEVNKKLNNDKKADPVVVVKPSNDEIYRVRKSWNDSKSQIGAYRSIVNAQKACREGYSVFDSKGNVLFSNVKKETTPAKKSNTEVAKEVINGKWGNGVNRKKALEKAGYVYAEIQKLVNKLLKK